MGEYVIRPASLGDDYLTISIKLTDDIITHDTIRELDKPIGAELGPRLQIGNDEFTSLQEINDRYVKELMNRV